MSAIARFILAASVAAALGITIVFADVLSDLGVAPAEATQMAVQAVTAGSMPWGTARQKYRAATPEQRVAIVKNVMGWARTFTASPAFAQAYAQARDHMKPSAPEAALGMDDRMKQQMAEIDKSEAELKKQLANQPEQLKQMIESLETARKQMQEMAKNPDMRQAMDQQNVQVKKDYDARLAKFDADHPADINSAIAIRLHEFLNTCGDVDFAAKLKPAGSKMAFVDPQYERKPSAWKVCYRAGQQPVETARALAQEWLKAMGK